MASAPDRWQLLLGALLLTAGLVVDRWQSPTELDRDTGRHVARVELVAFPRPDAGHEWLHRPTCSCGWRSAARSVKGLVAAMDDVAWHLADPDVNR